MVSSAPKTALCGLCPRAVLARATYWPDRIMGIWFIKISGWVAWLTCCRSIIDHSLCMLPVPDAHPQGNLQGTPSLLFCWFSLALLPLITECDRQGALRQDFKPVQHIRFLSCNQFFSLLILKHHSASFWFSLAPKTPSNYISLNTEAIREMSALIFQMFMTISWSGY